jgi:polyisoprenyl-phosphate glycosyltransferase
MRTLSIVVPILNEAEGISDNLRHILHTISTIADTEWEIVAVDDGSTDDTPALLREISARDQRIRLLALNRNFGKEAAIQAGLAAARGDAVVVMDSDLQHPPELIQQMLDLWSAGALVVDGVKQNRGQESVLAGLLTQVFYLVFAQWSKITIANASDYKLLDRIVVDAYLALPERNRFFRGLIPWMGFTTAQVPFSVAPRRCGATSWSFSRLIGLAVSALTAFSAAPLHLVTSLGVVVFLVSILFGSVALYQKLMGTAVSGFTTVILLLLFLGSSLMISLGIIGVYIARIYDECKGRPTYLIDRRKSSL